MTVRQRLSQRFALAGRLTPVLVGVVLLLQTPMPAAEPAAEARVRESEVRLRKDIFFLASDECEGRGPTTQGLNRAADPIANEFKMAGLKPGGKDGTYFQPFTIPGSVLEGPARLALRGPKGQEITLKQGVHFQPMGLSGGGKRTGEVV